MKNYKTETNTLLFVWPALNACRKSKKKCFIWFGKHFSAAIINFMLQKTFLVNHYNLQT
jgi:hypothetical protein